MSGSIIDPGTINAYRVIAPIRVEVRQNWTDPWTTNAGYIPLSATIPLAGQSTGSAQFQFSYGQVKQPGSATISQVSPQDLDRWWVRFLAAPYTENDVFWLGRINNENLQVHGNPLGINDSGIQTFTAWDGTDLLRKRSIHATVFQGPAGDEGNLQVIDWLIPVGVDRYRANRGDTKISDAFGDQFNYWYGVGTDDWLVKDFLEMLIIGYMNSHTNEPKWRLDFDDFEIDVADEAERDGLGGLSAGQRVYVRDPGRCDEWDGLAWIEDVACSPLFAKLAWRPKGETSNIWHIFNQVLQKQGGLSSVVYPTSEGFTVKIMSLANTDVVVGEAELQANPNTVVIDAQSTVDGKRIHIERSMVDVYDTVRIIGPRVVSVATFEILNNSLVPAWSNSLQTHYQTNLVNPAATDLFRTTDQFRQCFQCFKVTDQVGNYPTGSVPSVDANGNITGVVGGVLQTRFRSALPNLPLKEGIDYSVEPPIDRSFDKERTPHVPPLVIIQDAAGNYIKAEDAGMAVSVLNDDLGIQFHNQLPHRVGIGRFAGTTLAPAEYDTTEMVATLAWETDQRLILTRGAAVSPFKSNDGIMTLDYSRETIAWYLAPNTVLGINGDGTLFRSPNANGWTLENDKYLLEQKAAGAEARYLQNRYRAKLKLAGFLPWSGLVGQILQVTNASAKVSDSKSVISAITWNFGQDYETQIRTGFFPTNL